MTNALRDNSGWLAIRGDSRPIAEDSGVIRRAVYQRREISGLHEASSSSGE